MKQSFTKAIQAARSPSVAVPIITFVVGIAAGHTIATSFSKPAQSARVAAQNTHADSGDPVENETKRVADGYEYAKQQIERDLEAKRLTIEQGALLTKKVNEVYDYRKSVIGKNDARDQLQAKRQEWRDWAKEQKFSSRYFVRLY